MFLKFPHKKMNSKQPYCFQHW